MINKPLHVQVWEKLHGLDVGTTGAWAVIRSIDCEQFPRYDLDWSATGPLIERLGIGLYLAADGWRARKSDIAVHVNSVRHATPLLAVCNLILALPDEAVR